MCFTQTGYILKDLNLLDSKENPPINHKKHFECITNYWKYQIKM